MALPTVRSSISTTEVATFEHSWTIKNIGGLYGGTAEYTELNSPTFVAPPERITTVDKKPVEFRLRFGSTGHNLEAQDMWISLRKMNGASLDILYTLSVVKANGEKCVVGTPKSQLEYSGSKSTYILGQTQMYASPIIRLHKIPRDQFFNSANGFVYNDSITLHCEVNILTIMAKSVKPDQVDLYGQLAKSFGDLLESGAHSNVTFVDGDGQEHRAHKNILAARSQVFADMFEFSPEDNSTNPIVIVESRDVFKQVLCFIYTGNVSTSLNGIAKNLLISADKYQLDALKSICEDYLVSSISAESDLIELLQLTSRINVPNLKLKVLELMAFDFDFDSHIMTLVQMKRPLTGLPTNSMANKKSKKS